MRGGLIGEQHVTNRVARYEHALLQRKVWRRNVKLLLLLPTLRFCTGLAISERDFVDEPLLCSRNRVVLAFTQTLLRVRVCVCMNGQSVCAHRVLECVCISAETGNTLTFVDAGREATG